MISSEETDLRITWLVAIVLGGIVLYLGIRGVVNDSPTSEWIPLVAAGMAIVLTYVVTEVSHWLDQSPSDQFGLSDWTALLLTGSWIAIGASLYVSELSRSVALLFAFFGAIGFVGMLYKWHRIRNR